MSATPVKSVDHSEWEDSMLIIVNHPDEHGVPTEWHADFTKYPIEKQLLSYRKKKKFALKEIAEYVNSKKKNGSIH